METEKFADLTTSAKKILEDVLDSYKEKESIIKAYAAQSQAEANIVIAKAKDIEQEAIIKSKKILEKAECDSKATHEQMDKDKEEWEKEKKSIARTYHFENNEIKLDIGGQCFTTTLTTLTRFPDTMIGAMFSGRHNLKKNDAGAYFIDRDGIHFRHILNFLRSPENHVLKMESNLKEELENEAEFYGLSDRMFPVPFCPAQPMDFNANSITLCRVTQDAQGMWFISLFPKATTITLPKAVCYCPQCDRGWIKSEKPDFNNFPTFFTKLCQNIFDKTFEDRCNMHFFEDYCNMSCFNTGREILPCQPTYSAQDPCPRCRYL
jgi:hypothetical protein